MPRPVFKDGTIAKGALAVGQTLRLGGFLMTACSATAPTMTSQVIKSDLHVSPEFAEQLDPIELSSVNELLDRIAALGVATDYNQIGPKPVIGPHPGDSSCNNSSLRSGADRVVRRWEAQPHRGGC